MKTYILTFNVSYISGYNEKLTTIISESATIENFEDLNSLDRANKLKELIGTTTDYVVRQLSRGGINSITEVKIGAITPV